MKVVGGALDVQIRVRKYRKADNEAILRIATESFDGFCLAQNVEREFGRAGGSSWQESKRGDIEYDLHKYPSDAFVAETEGKVVGFVCTRLYQASLTGHVANLAVDHAYQGMGVGKMLMRAATRHFVANGMRYGRIETLEQNHKAVKFYPSMGFREVGRRIYYLKQL